MYKMILVDDESLSLKIFSKIIEQNCEGFNLIATFDNATDAIKYITDNHVDVIISDISMPGITGLDFLEYVEKTHNNIVFIILTGFKNFEYMKFAISHNAAEYLTKPLDKDELKNVLSKVKTKLDENISNAENNYSELICHRSLTKYISSGLESEKSLLSSLNEAGLNISRLDTPIAIIHTKINNIDAVITHFRYGPNGLHTALIQMFRMNDIPVLSLNYSISSMNLILFSNNNKNNDFQNYINTVLDEFRNNCKQLLSIEITASIKEIFTSLDEAKNEITKILNINLETTQITVNNKHINKAIKFIEENYNQDISLSDVASHLHLNSVHLSKLFKANTGCNFIKYITNYRIKKAQHMLLNTFMTITEISNMTGFSNTNNFYRIFKKITGMSPQQYRNTQIGKQEIEDKQYEENKHMENN